MSNYDPTDIRSQERAKADTDLRNKLAGNVLEGIGKATDNASLEAEGKAQKLKGSAQDVKGSVKGALGDNI